MTNPTERYPEYQRSNPRDRADPSSTDGTSGERQPDEQDPSKRNPQPIDDPQPRADERPGQGEKRSA